MQKFLIGCFKNIFFSFLLLIASVGAYANHVNGVDLSYTYVGPGNLYRITLTVYGHCGATSFGTLATATPTICIFDSSHYMGSVTLALSGPGTNVSNVCPGYIDSTSCSTTPSVTYPGLVGTMKYIYTATYTLPSAQKCWRFVFAGGMGGTSAGRSNAITNINAPGTSIIYLQDTLNNLTSNNSSPNLTIIPTPYYCLNNADSYDPGGIDPDGDSLSYALVNAMSNGGMSCTVNAAAVSYVGAYTGANPLAYTPGTFSFNSTTGQISFTPNALQCADVVYNIREYRGGTVVGTSQREMTFLVQTCTNTPPNGSITGATIGTIVDSVHYSVCQGSGAFSFQIHPTEPDTSNTINVTATGVPAWATLTIINNLTNHPTVTFSGNSSTVAPGTYTFTLTLLDNNCPIAGSNSIAYYVTIAAVPTTITFPKDSVCVGSTVTYADATAGGTWTSGSTTIATVGSTTGIVTGVSAGSTTITYTTASAGCYRDTTIVVSPVPAAITGTFNVCVGSITSLADGTAGGTWSSGTTTVATVGGTGAVTGVANGTSVIKYTLSTGCFASATVSVNSLPAAIGGASSTVCAGSTINLTDATVGGSWTSSNTAVATVAGGTVTGVSGGTAIISYSLGTGCAVTRVVTVNPLPSIITGFSSLCVGTNVTLTDSIVGGTWTSSNTTVATIASIGAGIAQVNGLSAGTTTIIYTLPTGCARALVVTVVGLPAAITGTLSVCTGATTPLANGTPGGTWTSSNTAVATISGTGVVTGVTAGTSNITYTVGTGCYVTAIVTVNLTPLAIGGSLTICLGGTSLLTDATAGGTWSSVNTGVATISVGGLVSSVSVGSSVISYTRGACAATATVSVNNAPAAITGTRTLCNTFTTNLADAVPGGTWTSTNTAVATISGTGVVTGVSAGTSLISYSIGTCVATATVTVYVQPAAIGGTFAICNLTSTLLTDATPGGTWTSVSSGVATITGGGLVTGVTVGTTVISYTIGSCAATVTETISALPSAGSITGVGTVCVGGTTPLTDGTPSGVWSSVNTGIATVSGTGLVTGVAIGTDSIKYTVTNGCGTAFASTIVTVNPLPNAGSISGPTSVCAGSLITLLDGAAGGVWSASNANATVVGGVVTGVTAGTDIISYTVTNSCGTANATYPITINVAPTAGSISGPAIICAGSFALMTDLVSGGVWSMSNANATISGTGMVTGVTGGVDSITYSVTNSCGVAVATKVVTISPLPVGAPVTGPTAVCVMNTITMNDAVAGGTWHATNGFATISGTGVVTGVSGGLDTIYYALTNSCGTTYDSAFVTVNPLPNPGTITGPSTVCIGSVITLTDPAPGGVYSASNGSATITAGAVVTGIFAGIDTITYTVTNVCGTATTQRIITVIPPPSTGSISGPTSVCVGSTILLTNSVSGGTWSSANADASVTSGGGVVTGLIAGNDTILYSIVTACGSAVNLYPITVNPLPSAGTISGPSTVCAGSLITLTSIISGGIWSISNSHATIGSGTGVVIGSTAGLDTVSYAVSNMCGTATLTYPLTVNPYPFAGVITGATTLCPGTSVTLTESVSGGVWSSSNTLISTVSAGGVVTGVTGGADTISYTVSNSCGTVGTYQFMTVNPLPNPGTIVGATNVCLGSSIMLIDAVPGGVWSSVYTTIATVSGGLVTGLSVGVDTIKYSLTNMCGTVSAVKAVAVVTFPSSGTITGPNSVCVGGGITLLDGVPGGVWIASNGNATILSTGVVTGVTVGIDTIVYSVTNSCGTASTSKIITVNPLPAISAISGPANVCTGSSVSLTDLVSGGSWTSSNSLVATVGLATGLVSGISVGTSTITYSVTNGFGCNASVTQLETVNLGTIVPAITGTLGECIGNTTTLTDAMSGGTWSSSNTAIATIDAATGVVTGISAGIATITYSITTICGISYATANNTVNALPVVAAISGTLSGCVGLDNTLTDATSGGVWSSSNTLVATVSSTTGVVTGISAGMATINYLVTSGFGCSTSVSGVYTVNPLPVAAPISGTTNECVGSTQLFTDGTPGGTWSSSNTAIASIDATGLLTGISSGIVTVSYLITNSYGCVGGSSVQDTVNSIPVPAPITGTLSVCVGATTALANSVPWGVWSSGNFSVASVNSGTGVVTGVTAGNVTIYYTVNNSCGLVVDSAIVSVIDAPAVAAITGTTTVLCSGTSTALSDATTGGVWSSSNTAIATVSSTGLVSGIAAGVVTITYTVTNISGCSAYSTYNLTFTSSIGSSYVVPSSASLCPGHNVYMYVVTAGSGLTYQWLHNGVAITGATNFNYTTDSVGSYSVIVSNGSCTETLTGPNVIIFVSPVINFSAPNILYTGTYSHYQWYRNGVAIPGATNSIYYATSTGSYVVSVTDANGCTGSSSSYLVHSTGGVVNIDYAKEIKLYPNPATELIHVDAPISVNVRIISPDGKTVIEQNNAVNINVANLANGLYIIMVYDSNDFLLKTDKFMKVN